MLILYTKNGCQYCEEVKEAFGKQAVSYEERNIKDPAYLAEVKSYGAKTLPFLVDTTANTTIGESDEIIAYGLEGSF